MDSKKQEILKKIYYDRSGYGSMQMTFQDAKKKDNSITLQDTRDFFKNNVSQKKQQRGSNSFIAPYANYEYQLDLFFINDIPKQKFKIGMVIIDSFSKYMAVIPIVSKDESNVAAGLLEGLEQMKNKPKFLYTDDEAALSKPDMKQYFEDNNIHHIVTRSHAHMAERAIRTFKDSLYKRVDNMKDDNIQWSDLIFEILLTYNNKIVHTTTGMTPSEARLPKNRLTVWTNTYIKSKQTRIYPVLSIGDKVKILRKKKPGEKERTSVWSDEIYNVDNIFEKNGQTFHMISNNKQYIRHELLKV